jgi:hypothetical protein
VGRVPKRPATRRESHDRAEALAAGVMPPRYTRPAGTKTVQNGMADPVCRAHVEYVQLYQTALLRLLGS